MVDNQKVVQNKIKARGRVVGFGKDYQGRNEIYIFMRQDYQARPINVSFLFRNIDPEIRVGDFVEIEGHIMAYYRQSSTFDQNRKRTYVQHFVADSIEFCKTEIEEVFGVKGGFAHKPMFRCYYSGEVTRINLTKGTVRDVNNRNKTREVTFVNLLVKVPSDDVTRRLNIISAQYTERMRTNDVNVEVGDKVVIAANVTSTKKQFPGQDKPVFFTNLQIDDMVIVEKGVKKVDTPSSEPIENSASEPKTVNEAEEKIQVTKAEPKNANVEAQKPDEKSLNKEEKSENVEKPSQEKEVAEKKGFQLEEEENEIESSDSVFEGFK